MEENKVCYGPAPVLQNIPGGAVKLKGEDGVICMTYLANEATLCTQITLENMVGGKLQKCHQVGCKLTLCYLKKTKTHIFAF